MATYQQRKAKSIAKIRANRQHNIDKDQFADIVHNCVCEYTQTDGLGACHLYALAGWIILSSLTKQNYYFQAGDFRIYPDPENEICKLFDPADGNLSYHCWILGPVPAGLNQQGDQDLRIADPIIIDFSARHYRAMIETLLTRDMPEQGLQWERQEMKYLWCKHSEKPNWLQFSAQSEITSQIMNIGIESKFCEFAAEYYLKPNSSNLKNYPRDPRLTRSETQDSFDFRTDPNWETEDGIVFVRKDI